MNMKRILVYCAALLLLAACGRPTMTVALDQEPSAQYAGIYAAIQQGYYNDAGLDVSIKYVSAGKGFESLQNGEADIIDEPLLNALYFKGKSGMDITNFLQTSQTSSIMVVSQLEFSEFSQLEGKTIGYVDNGTDLLVRALVALKGMNVNWIKVTDYHDFLDKKCDAYVTPYYGDIFYLAQDGAAAVYIYSLTRMGFDIPDDGLYTTAKAYRKDKDAYKRFADATVKGWNYCDSSYTKGVELAMDEIARNGGKGDYKHQDWILKQVISMQIDPIAKKKINILLEETEDAASSVLVRAKMLDKPVSVIPGRTSAPGSTGVELKENNAVLDSILNTMSDSTAKSAPDSASKKK